MVKEAFPDPGMFCKLFLVPDLACDFPFSSGKLMLYRCLSWQLHSLLSQDAYHFLLSWCATVCGKLGSVNQLLARENKIHIFKLPCKVFLFFFIINSIDTSFLLENKLYHNYVIDLWCSFYEFYKENTRFCIINTHILFLTNTKLPTKESRSYLQTQKIHRHHHVWLSEKKNHSVSHYLVV